MTDRIANPWGERTPFGQGEDWPVRVDQFLEDGVSEGEVDRWVQTASILHSNGDALACDITWTMIGQAAQGARDTELLEVVGSCEGETAVQIKWLRTRMKQAAPQALLVTS